MSSQMLRNIIINAIIYFVFNRTQASTQHDKIFEVDIFLRFCATL
jgi:hypothetical protein